MLSIYDDYAKIGNSEKIGNYVDIGNSADIGDHVKIGNHVDILLRLRRQFYKLPDKT